MRKLSGFWVVVALVGSGGLLGCGKKDESAGPPASTGSSGSAAVSGAGTAGSAAAGSAAPTAPPPPAPPSASPPPADPAAGSPPTPGTPPVASAELPPLAADVLPKGEVSDRARVVLADGYRYQVPQDFMPASRDGHVAYTGTVSGFGNPTKLTFWAHSEPFKGNLDALLEREKKTPDAEGAEIGGVMVMVGGNIKQNYGKRMTIRGKDRIELRTIVVHGGKAFIHHCETPNEANAWASVGSDCIARGLTFHIAPPPVKASGAGARGKAPETPNVGFMMSKITGTARKKADVNPWLDDAVAPHVKPCLAKLPSGSTWHVTFEIGADGTPSKVEVGDGDAMVKPAESDCAAKALAGAKLEGKASGAVTVDAVFMIN